MYIYIGLKSPLPCLLSPFLWCMVALKSNLKPQRTACKTVAVDCVKPQRTHVSDENKENKCQLIELRERDSNVEIN